MLYTPFQNANFDSHLPRSPAFGKSKGRLSKLPNEILVKIIELVMASHSIQGYHKFLNEVRLVCKFWDDFIVSTPSLWAVITNTDPTEVSRVALELSRDYPLTISLDTQTARNHRLLLGVRFILRVLAPQSHRWLVLRVKFLSREHFLQELLSNPTPNLRFLSVDMVRENHSEARPAIVTTEMSSLVQITAPRYLLASDIVSFWTLRSVEIAHDGNWPSLKIMLEALPDLEALILHKYRGPACNDEKTPSIILPTLRKLSIIGLPSPYIEDIIRSIEAQRLCYFAILLSPGGALNIGSDIPSLGKFLSLAVQNNLSLPRFLSVGQDLISWLGQRGQTTEDVGRVQLSTTTTAQTIRWIAELIETGGEAQSLDVKVQLGFGARATAKEVLRALTTLRHVRILDLVDRTLSQRVGGLQEWLYWLTPIPKPGSLIRFPMICELSVTTSPENDILHLIRECVRARIISSGSSDSSLPAPEIPLKTIVIHNGKLNAVTLRDIQQLLGPESTVVLPDGRHLSAVGDDDRIFHPPSIPNENSNRFIIA